MHPVVKVIEASVNEQFGELTKELLTPELENILDFHNIEIKVDPQDQLGFQICKNFGQMFVSLVSVFKLSLWELECAKYELSQIATEDSVTWVNAYGRHQKAIIQFKLQEQLVKQMLEIIKNSILEIKNIR